MLNISSLKKYFPCADITVLTENLIVFNVGVFKFRILLTKSNTIDFEIIVMPPGKISHLVQAKRNIDSQELCYQEIRTFLLSQQTAITKTLDC